MRSRMCILPRVAAENSVAQGDEFKDTKQYSSVQYAGCECSNHWNLNHKAVFCVILVIKSK